MEGAVVAVQVGQCGNQLWPEVLDTLCSEPSTLRRASSRFFREADTPSAQCDDGDGRAEQRRMVARTVLVDTEPKVVASALQRSSRLWEYSRGNAHVQQGGAANNWAYGYSRLGTIAWDSCADLIRRELERADLVDAVVIAGSVAGGTGSGVGSCIAERMRDELIPRGTMMQLLVWPYSGGDVVLQHLNASLTLSHATKASDAVLLVENDRAHELCVKTLGLKDVTMADLNRAIARQIVHALLPADPARLVKGNP
eukprot:m51a1_g5491 putative delta tubulin (255) ;mRNA; f:326655-331549